MIASPEQVSLALPAALGLLFTAKRPGRRRSLRPGMIFAQQLVPDRFQSGDTLVDVLTPMLLGRRGRLA